jgi:hypothetical protein
MCRYLPAHCASHRQSRFYRPNGESLVKESFPELERKQSRSIIPVFIDPLKKRLAEYLESFKPKILALPGKPLDLIRRQRLGNDRINLISFP